MAVIQTLESRECGSNFLVYHLKYVTFDVLLNLSEAQLPIGKMQIIISVSEGG